MTTLTSAKPHSKTPHTELLVRLKGASVRSWAKSLNVERVLAINADGSAYKLGERLSAAKIPVLMRSERSSAHQFEHSSSILHVLKLTLTYLETDKSYSSALLQRSGENSLFVQHFKDLKAIQERLAMLPLDLDPHEPIVRKEDEESIARGIMSIVRQDKLRGPSLERTFAGRKLRLAADGTPV